MNITYENGEYIFSAESVILGRLAAPTNRSPYMFYSAGAFITDDELDEISKKLRQVNTDLKKTFPESTMTGDIEE